MHSVNLRLPASLARALRKRADAELRSVAGYLGQVSRPCGASEADRGGRAEGARGGLSALDRKIATALDLAIELGPGPAVKDRLRSLRAERDSVAGELARSRIDLPTAEELMPLVEEKLRDIEATIRADVARGRLALGALLGGRRLRVYRDGRIEGMLALEPKMKLPAPRRSQEPADSVVAGGRFARVPWRRRARGYRLRPESSAHRARLVNELEAQ